MTAFVAVLVIGAALPPLVVIGLRLSGLDERHLLGVRLVSFGLWLLAPSVIGVGVSAALSITGSAPAWWALVPAALMVGAAYLVYPPSLRARPPAAPPAGPTLRLVSLNVERDTPAAEALAGVLLGLDGDVVLVQEYTPSTRDACIAAGLAAAYPHTFEDVEDGYFGSAVFSRRPLSETKVVEAGARPMVIATVDVDGRAVQLVNVHLQAPIEPPDIVRWRTSFDELAAIARTADAAGRPVLMIGDWNATLAHRPFQRLLRGDLQDGHRSAGRWYPRSWPVGRRIPPVLCLDHLAHSSSVAVTAIREVTQPGTDHRTLVAEIQLP